MLGIAAIELRQSMTSAIDSTIPCALTSIHTYHTSLHHTGGVGVVAPRRDAPRPSRKQLEGVVEVEDDNWKVDSHGQPGEELALHLQVGG